MLVRVYRHLHKMAATSSEGVVLRKALRWEVAAEQNHAISDLRAPALHRKRPGS